MSPFSIRHALRALLLGAPASAEPLVVQAIGFHDSSLPWLASLIEGAGRELGRSCQLDRSRGDLVLADGAFVRGVTPQMLNAFVDERPLVTLNMSPSDAADPVRRASLVHAELVRQMRALGSLHSLPTQAALSTLPPSSGFDSQFDSRQHGDQLDGADLDPDRAQVLNLLRRGLADPTQPQLVAGFGPMAAIVIDFATGVATIDPLAEQQLRLGREVPYLAPAARPAAGARHRELDLMVWDIAVAAGGFRLLHSPVNWWHSPLIAQPRLDVSRFTLLPQHREMARCLAAAPISPADLRRRSRVSLTDLRGFLQACLFLGLAYWVPAGRD